MPQRKIDRRNFLKLSAGALGSSLALNSGCAYYTPIDVPVIPPPTKRVFVCSDIHIGLIEDNLDGEAWFTRALSDLTTIGPVNYAFALGDLAQNGTAEEFLKYAAIRDASVIPDWYELAGNHEYFSEDIESYFTIVTPDKAYMVYDGNLVYFFLSDEISGAEGNITDATFVWLIDNLSKNQDKNIILCTHQCVYGTIRDSMNSNRHIYPKEMIEEILKTYRIDLWLCGHQHYYPYAAEDMFYNGRTHFINVSSVHHAYDSQMSESVILHLTEGAQEITAYRRVHDTGQYDTRFTVQVPVPFPVELSRNSIHSSL